MGYLRILLEIAIFDAIRLCLGPPALLNAVPNDRHQSLQDQRRNIQTENRPTVSSNQSQVALLTQQQQIEVSMELSRSIAGFYCCCFPYFLSKYRYFQPLHFATLLSTVQF